jgi:hypothetical protein
MAHRWIEILQSGMANALVPPPDKFWTNHSHFTLEIVDKLLIYWLPGTDYSALRASPCGSPYGRSPPLRGVVEPACFLSAVRIRGDVGYIATSVAKKFEFGSGTEPK